MRPRGCCGHRGLGILPIDAADLVVVVRDIGVLAIVGSLVLQALTSHRALNREARREL